MKLYILFLILMVWSGISAQNWVQLDSNTSVNLNAVTFNDINTGIAVGDNGTILRTVNGGEQWELIPSNTSSHLKDVSFSNQNVVLAVGYGPTILRSANSGESWEEISVAGLNYDLLSVSLHSSGNGIAGGFAQTILRTEDHGQNWDVVQTDYFGGGFWGAYMTSNNIGFVAGENSIFQPLVGRTLNAGSSFGFYAFYLEDNGNYHEGRLYDCYFFDDISGFTVAARWDGWGCITHTTNLSNWISSHYPDPIFSIDFHGNDGYVVGGSGLIKYTSNSGGEWEDDWSGYSVDLNGVDVQENAVYAVGDNGYILKKNLGTVVDKNNIPQSITFLSAYPNPYTGENNRNKGITISFNLKIPGRIKLDLFNIQGKFLDILLQDDFGAGEYTISWDIDPYPPGIYLYRLQTENSSRVHKIIKLK
ncbi:MAG: T9SS type A sorting domain-containing protein [Candidatus Cloacimonetes bacterium]|nr:T9SS type A sorting domain-containing protein [Candidatus Cloacimonadota bacterium]